MRCIRSELPYLVTDWDAKSHFCELFARLRLRQYSDLQSLDVATGPVTLADTNDFLSERHLPDEDRAW